MPKPVPDDQRVNLSRDTVRQILRDTAEVQALLDRIENRLRFSLSEKPASDGNGDQG